MGVIILLCGQAGSGKSTLARRLHDLLGAEIVPMAQQLKEDVAAALGCTVMDLSLQDFKNRPTQYIIDVEKSYEEDKLILHKALDGVGDTPRKIMQLYGTDVMRERDPDCWVRQWCYRVQCMNVAYVVADDVRFLNEISFVKASFDGTMKMPLVFYIRHPQLDEYSFYAPRALRDRYKLFNEQLFDSSVYEHPSEYELAYTAEQASLRDLANWYDKELVNIFGAPEATVIDALRTIREAERGGVNV